MLLRWSDPATNFWWLSWFPPPPPPCLHFPSTFEWSPSESFQSFQRSPPFGFSVTTDPPFCSPKNQVIPTKILRPPVINNDRSLIWEGLNRWFIACENSRFSSLLTTRVVSYDETSQAARSLERGLFRRLDDLKEQVHVSKHAHLSKCCFSAGTCCIVYASNMIMS